MKGRERESIGENTVIPLLLLLLPLPILPIITLLLLPPLLLLLLLPLDIGQGKGQSQFPANKSQRENSDYTNTLKHLQKNEPPLEGTLKV